LSFGRQLGLGQVLPQTEFDFSPDGSLVKRVRNEDLRQDKTSFGMVDAQSVQNANTAEEKGYDAGKSIRDQKDV